MNFRLKVLIMQLDEMRLNRLVSGVSKLHGWLISPSFMGLRRQPAVEGQRSSAASEHVYFFCLNNQKTVFFFA
jgi:hypothetical protein